MENNGPFGPNGLLASNVFNAATGQIIVFPSAGMTMVLVSFLSRMVFDHLSKIVAPIGEKKISPLHKCLVTSKLEEVCGSIFEILRKEKKAKVYNAMKMSECGNCGQIVTISNKI